MTVLVVDDSAAIRERLVETLSAIPAIGHVLSAANAAQAREAIWSHQPDVVVLDIHLPDGSGIDVLRAISSRNLQILAIVLTNDSSMQCRTASFRAGATVLFDKSTEFQKAIDLVAHWAKKRAAAEDGQ